MSLKWLANNVSKWGGTYGFPYIFFEGPAEGYVNTKNGSVRAYTREEWQAAREHLADEGNSVTWSGRISLAGNHELADERMDAIAQNVAWAEDERRMNAMNSTYNHWQHLTDDITAYDPPGPTNIPECTFTTPDEDEAWAEAERRMDAIGQNGNDGLHYNLEDVAFVRAEGKQPRYQDATGEDWIDEAARTFTVEEFRGAMRFSIGKYNRRMGKKDDLIKEIEKMRDYCQRWIDVEKGR